MARTLKDIGALPPHLVADAVRMALAEDLGLAGDLTSQAALSGDAVANASFAAREPGIIAGMALVVEAFRQIGGDVRIEHLLSDGDAIDKYGVAARVSGNARQVLAAERVALNFLNHLSGVATQTRRFVDAIEGTNARICDTRKTTPGLRALEKYAVRCGGGWNHRFALSDAILIKDNHIAVAGGAAMAYKAARALCRPSGCHRDRSRHPRRTGRSARCRRHNRAAR